MIRKVLIRRNQSYFSLIKSGRKAYHLYGLFCLLFCACVPAKRAQVSMRPEVSLPCETIGHHTCIKEQEAKLYDIPRFIDADPLPEYFEQAAAPNASLVAAYLSERAVEEVASFYQQEMSFFGWKSLCHVQGKEQLLVFEKPTRWCFVSVRLQDEKTMFLVSTCPKEDDC